MDPGLRSAFRLEEKWSIPGIGSINPRPNVGPGGEIHASSYGNFTEVKDGKIIVKGALHSRASSSFDNNKPVFGADSHRLYPDVIRQHRGGVDEHIVAAHLYRLIVK